MREEAEIGDEDTIAQRFSPFTALKMASAA